MESNYFCGACKRHRDLWQGGPVRLGWKQSRLTVAVAGQKFTGVLDLATGTYRHE